MSPEVYLGDGLYASFDGFMFILRAPRGGGDHWGPREGGDHWVGLEPEVLEAFLEFVNSIKNDGEKK